MRSRTGRVLWAFLFAAIGFGAARAADYVVERDASVPEPTPPTATGISATAKTIRTVPDVSDERRSDAVDDLGDTLRKLYELAFTRPPDETPPPTPRATPTPARRVRELMTDDAVATLKRSPDAFDIGALSVTDGRVVYEGVITFGLKKPSAAYLDVDFVGRAVPVGRTSPVARVHQRGTLSLKRASSGWRIDGFDLRFATRPEPTPSPTADV
jgi:hypothetical protein